MKKLFFTLFILASVFSTSLSAGAFFQDQGGLGYDFRNSPSESGFIRDGAGNMHYHYGY